MMEEENTTVWCGNLAEQVTEELLYELFLQAGPVQKVRIPRERDGRKKNFAFIHYSHEISVPYALSLFRGTALFNRTLTMTTRSRNTVLPPPIRCIMPEMPVDYRQIEQNNLVKQINVIIENIREEPKKSQSSQRQEPKDKLVLASLQGNWSHRHHPYKPQEKSHHVYESKEKVHGRNDYRSRERDYKGQGNRRNRQNFRNRMRN